MRFGTLSTALLEGLSFVFGNGDHPDGHDEELARYMGPNEAAMVARKMAAFEHTLHANTIDRESGTPVSFIEYFVGSDVCHGVETSSNGSIILLLLNMSSTSKNWYNDSKFSVSIEKSNHWKLHKPAMATPRANYFGELKPLEASKALERCFLKRHPDARWWIPGGDHDQVHDGQWFEFDVSEVRFIGGFGDSAYIGTISGEDYQGAFNGSHPHRPPHHPPHNPFGNEHEDREGSERGEKGEKGEKGETRPAGRKLLSPQVSDHEEVYFQVDRHTKDKSITSGDKSTDKSGKMRDSKKKPNSRVKCGTMKVALDF
ncbi:uncharacterized protein LALA0_S10e05270g [Lachancea lanzarotensis]|uniref:LALA0S10e05270g1_1 n=1 Tax=Lachancea lanzarotensis TaxID=1245769 RepID=A0A0C7N8I7_9SACH|nr:uncharacterized protein LALA0_S10e05270g [Lachancea lanzarotensis]CEP64221.1 LALA0S10e05270g1_1 [Lachancea lanzarotensis]